MSDEPRRSPLTEHATIDGLAAVLTRLDIRGGDVVHIDTATPLPARVLDELNQWASDHLCEKSLFFLTVGGDRFNAGQDDMLAELGLQRIQLECVVCGSELLPDDDAPPPHCQDCVVPDDVEPEYG